jgi:KTSC domain-containing protein
MRRGILSQGSDLIRSIGHEGTTLEVEYQDHTIFQYFGVPLSTFKAIVRAKHPGRAWLKLRDQYKIQEGLIFAPSKSRRCLWPYSCLSFSREVWGRNELNPEARRRFGGAKLRRASSPRKSDKYSMLQYAFVGSCADQSIRTIAQL